MAVAYTTSRFAVLSVEDDDDDESSKARTKSQSPCSLSSGKASMSSSSVAPNDKTKPKKKKKNASSENADLQNLAFGSVKPKSKGNGKKSAAAQNSKKVEKQWEEWKKRDNEFVSEAFEQDLHQALLLSKLDFEEKKENLKKEPEQNGRSEAPDGKKKKKNNLKKDKPATMSLEEFQNLLPTQLDGGLNKVTPDVTDKPKERLKPVCQEPNFFDQIEVDAEKIILKEQRDDEYKRTQLVTNEPMMSLMYQEDLQRKDNEILELTASLEKLKEEMKTVKYRNKRLCNILAQGEMRDKAEILVQIDQLTQVKDELTEQVTELHASLEQERSKVHQLQTELKRFQSNKKETKEAK